MWLTDEQQQIWRGYLTMVSHLQTAMHRQLQQDCELSLSDYDVLVALSEGGPERINVLCEVLAWEQSRLSHQLRRMRGRGLVQRHGSGETVVARPSSSPTAGALRWTPPHRDTSSSCAPSCSPG